MENRNNKRWKKEEIEFVQSNIAKSTSWIASELNRSEGSIVTMVWKLRTNKNIVVSNTEGVAIITAPSKLDIGRALHVKNTAGNVAIETNAGKITLKHNESVTLSPEKPIWQIQIERAKQILIQEGMSEGRADNEISYALNFFHENPKLKNCTPDSILISIVNIGRTRITLNPVEKLSYLTDREGKCIFDPTYLGLIKALTDSGSVKVIDAHIVYEGDEFDYSPAESKLYHKPKIAMTEAENNARKIIGAYSVATLQDGTLHHHFMEIWNLEKIARLSNSNFYNEWKEDMFKKCVIRSHYKFLPKKDLPDYIQRAIVLDEENTGMDFRAGKNNKKKASMMDFFSGKE